MGKTAYDWIDFLKESGQSWWQILPLGPTSYGDSPYQSFSSAAGNPYLIDLDMLVEEGLLEKKDLSGINWGENTERVDYGAIFNFRFSVLYKAYLKGKDTLKEEFEAFRKENEEWVEDYALFMSLKKHFDMKSWLDWSDEKARKRDEETLKSYRETLSDDISYYAFCSFCSSDSGIILGHMQRRTT